MMNDNRIEKLASILLNHSCKLKKNKNIIIEGNESSKDLIIELVKQSYAMGAHPFVRLGNSQISREILMGMNEEQAKLSCKYALEMFNDAYAYIGIGSPSNIFEMSDVPNDKNKIYDKFYGQPIHMDIRVEKTNWVILKYPTPSFAQLGQMSTATFEDFFFNVCNLDYDKMHKAMEKLQTIMHSADKVRIIADETDLSFSIKNQKAVICSGESNIPDGEIYTSPLLKSVNGKIKFNIPSLNNGIVHSDIRLEFKDGKIINESSSNTKALTLEFNADDGARYVGEFAFGVNPYITKPMLDILFDEKMTGSIHMAMGNCYDNAPNGNKSQNHWDLILSMTPENGGGEVYFDDILISKNGRFVHKDLDCLNPENLK